METWLSGRKRLTANEVGCQSPRGFESLRLRKTRSPARKRWATVYLRETEGFEKSFWRSRAHGDAPDQKRRGSEFLI